MPFSSILNESQNLIPEEGMIPFEEILGEQFNKLEDFPDGSSLFEFNEDSDLELPVLEENDFYENLAKNMEENKLSEISSNILEGIDQDLRSREEWEQIARRGMKYLGFKLEDFKEVPFMAACRAFDTTLSTSLLRFCATAAPELFPEEGPIDIKPLGEKSDLLDHKAAVSKDTLNYYLTEVDREYYPDSLQMLMYVGLLGCAFRKVYNDPLTKRPIARLIDPQDLIINNDCVTILSSSRLTHREKLSKKEIKLRQKSGYYREVELPSFNDSKDDDKSLVKQINKIDGIDLSSYDNNVLSYVYECHVDLDNVEDEKIESKDRIPKPYIVSLCEKTRTVLGIWRNWQKDDPFYKRIEYFVQHDFLKGFGIYGYGLIHLAGSNSVVLTSVTRQLIDAGTLKNFPGGLMVKGMRIDDNNKAIGPSEFKSIETGGLPIQQAIMPMPYNEPSLVLKQLRDDLKQDTQNLISSTEMQIAESNTDVPVGTTLARLEVSNKVQNLILKSLHKSLSDELTLIYNLFKNSLSEQSFSFKLPGRMLNLSREDFLDDVKVISNSNPHLTTSTQRILQAESELRIAQSAPQLHDLRNCYINLYRSIGKSDEEINGIMPPPQEAIPLDPITENMNAMNGKPLKAGIDQDHNSHIMVHSQFGNDPSMQAHIREHQSFQYLIDMQMKMGMQMPDPQMLMNPEIQNQIALVASQVTQQEMQMQQDQQQQQMPIDPNEVIMADIAQRREEAILRDKDAHLKAEVEAFKSQQKFETEKMKIESNERLAADKNEVELMVTEMKEHKHIPIEGEI